VLGADELVLEAVGFLAGAAQQVGDARGGVDLAGLVGGAGEAL